MTAEQASKPTVRRLREWEVRFVGGNGRTQRIPFDAQTCDCLTIPLRVSRAIPTARIELWADDGRLYQAFQGGKTVEIGEERQEQLDRRREAVSKAFWWRVAYEAALMRNQPADPHDHGPGCSARISGKGNG